MHRLQDPGRCRRLWTCAALQPCRAWPSPLQGPEPSLQVCPVSLCTQHSDKRRLQDGQSGAAKPSFAMVVVVSLSAWPEHVICRHPHPQLHISRVSTPGRGMHILPAAAKIRSCSSSPGSQAVGGGTAPADTPALAGAGLMAALQTCGQGAALPAPGSSRPAAVAGRPAASRSSAAVSTAQKPRLQP